MNDFTDNLRLFVANKVGGNATEFRLVLSTVDKNGRPTATVASFDATDEMNKIFRAYWLGRKSQETSMI